MKYYSMVQLPEGVALVAQWLFAESGAPVLAHLDRIEWISPEDNSFPGYIQRTYDAAEKRWQHLLGK